MPCYCPIKAWYSGDLTESGKREIVFKRERSKFGHSLDLPCGRCVGCRLERSRQWAVRCMHEKKMHDRSAFVTLTYDEQHVPYGGTLVRRQLQLFMKRLRKKLGRGIRFYACGEYGDEFGRPHYHLLLFNVDFPDGVLCGHGKRGEPLYRSDLLYELWPYGTNYVGAVTFDSCAYVARYILKKVNGAPASDHYSVLCEHGEIVDREPEFTVMSRRPGIGSTWFDSYHPEVFAYDSVITNAHEAKPPRFYDIRYELLDRQRMDRLRFARRHKALLRSADNTLSRLRVRETVELRKLAFFKKREFL
ncbi:replication initiator protein [robinz microvirus RP_110]|nr:replication initiator protein [robinz microvirus RP_110]